MPTEERKTQYVASIRLERKTTSSGQQGRGIGPWTERAMTSVTVQSPSVDGLRTKIQSILGVLDDDDFIPKGESE